MNKSLLTADNIENCFIRVVLIKAAKQIQCIILDNDCSIRVYQSFIANISYYAGIMLNAFSNQLCWHNWLVPISYT